MIESREVEYVKMLSGWSAHYPKDDPSLYGAGSTKEQALKNLEKVYALHHPKGTPR